MQRTIASAGLGTVELMQRSASRGPRVGANDAVPTQQCHIGTQQSLA